MPSQEMRFMSDPHQLPEARGIQDLQWTII